MRVLVDTHVFLWIFGGLGNVSNDVREFLADTVENEFFFSIASAWEISIKYGNGKLKLPDVPERFVPNRAARANFKILPISLPHVLFVHNLPPVHKDPFDRLIVSQAQAEGLNILTADPIFRKYKVDVLNILKFKI
jgi:PIN domain nuclease of toxin-antitoxin system